MLNRNYLLLFIFCFGITFAQTLSDDEIDSQFRIGLTHLSNGLNDQALVIFDRLSGSSDYHSKTTLSLLLKSKILTEEKKYNQAKQSIKEFLENYSFSKYTDEARMLLVKINFEEANYFNALKEISFLIASTDSEEYKKRAKNYGRSIAGAYLNSVQIQRISDSSTNDDARAYLLLLLAQSYLKEKKEFSAKSALSEILKKYPSSEEFNEAQQLYDEPYLIDNTSSFQNIIGVLLPLKTNTTGQFTSTTAIEILEGIKFAVSEFNENRDDKIGIVVRDTGDDIELIKSIRDEFAFNPFVKVILGPLFSNEVRVTLDEFSDSDVPIVSPTATDDGLTSLSENFFQANPSFSKRGIIMAQYIYFVENKRNISVLNSIDGYSPLLASNFAEEFERLGGKILKRESYKSKSFSLSEPISKIASDSLMLEGIYIPLAENIDVPGILAELVRNNLRTNIYGNQDWFTAKGFETASGSSNNLTFTSDYYVDFNSESYQSFSDQFIDITGKDVNRNVLYGYDCAKYLLTAIRNTEPGRKNLVEKMISGMVSSGLHNNISFDSRRVNRYLNIVRYKDGRFELVDKFRLGQ